MNGKEKRDAGFTLVELLIVMCIAGVLIAIAVPSYQTYLRRAHYTELVEAAAPFKLGVHECYAITGDLSSCHSGKNGIPVDILETAEQSLIASITTSGSGVISVTPKERFGIHPEDQFILIPDASHNQLVWRTAGKGVSNGYAD
jgi:type IV pilus assembly protein PilA